MSIVLTQIVNLELGKHEYFIDFRKNIDATYLTINCNFAPLLIDIDIVKNTYTMDDNIITSGNTVVSNSNIRWPIKNGKFENMNIKLVEPTVDVYDEAVVNIFFIIQFYN